MNSAYARWQASAALGLAVARRAYRFWGSALPTGATIMLERRSQLRAPHPHFGNVTRLLQLLVLLPDTRVAGAARDDRGGKAGNTLSD
jgi:hypothetical protein